MIRVYLDQRRLRERGEIVWGFILQANLDLFGPGFTPRPATVIFGGPRLEDPAPLEVIARRLYALKDTRPKDPDLKTAVALTHETRRKLGREVPMGLTDGHLVYCSDLMIHRGHLPGKGLGRKLRHQILPIVVNPSETRCAMVLPAAFWPDELIQLWASS